MKRPLPLALASAFVLAAALLALGNPAAALRAQAMPYKMKPTPTPTPVGIAYDEIQRTAFGQETPPPPGSFPGDRAAIMAAANSMGGSMPHGMGGMLGHMMQRSMGKSMGAAMAMMHGSLKRYTYYWTRGWIRVDDPIAQTAKIYKCAQHQEIDLDLAHKTYRIINTNDEADNTKASYGSGSQAHAMGGYGMSSAPGTVLMSVHATSTSLGPKRLEGIPTHGYGVTDTMTMSHATGSCHNMNMSSHVVEYIASFGKPRAYCPLTVMPRGTSHGPVPTAMGGCKPKIVGSTGGMWGGVPSDRFAMYRMTQMSTSASAMGASFILERGNVIWFYNKDVPALFQIPAGFTKQQ